MPPLKISCPPASYRKVWPEVTAPNRSARAPSSSRTTVAPGRAAAARHVSVFSQPSAKPRGFRNRT
jgi:hypothetical protein